MSKRINLRGIIALFIIIVFSLSTLAYGAPITTAAKKVAANVTYTKKNGTTPPSITLTPTPKPLPDGVQALPGGGWIPKVGPDGIPINDSVQDSGNVDELLGAAPAYKFPLTVGRNNKKKLTPAELLKSTDFYKAGMGMAKVTIGKKVNIRAIVDCVELFSEAKTSKKLTMIQCSIVGDEMKQTELFIVLFDGYSDSFESILFSKSVLVKYNMKAVSVMKSSTEYPWSGINYLFIGDRNYVAYAPVPQRIRKPGMSIDIDVYQIAETAATNGKMYVYLPANSTKK